jgi:hypothetical protein
MVELEPEVFEVGDRVMIVLDPDELRNAIEYPQIHSGLEGVVVVVKVDITWDGKPSGYEVSTELGKFFALPEEIGFSDDPDWIDHLNNTLAREVQDG